MVWQQRVIQCFYLIYGQCSLKEASVCWVQPARMECSQRGGGSTYPPFFNWLSVKWWDSSCDNNSQISQIMEWWAPQALPKPLPVGHQMLKVSGYSLVRVRAVHPSQQHSGKPQFLDVQYHQFECTSTRCSFFLFLFFTHKRNLFL